MIAPLTRFRIARVPLAQIVVTMREPRYLTRIGEYAARLSAHPDEDVLLPVAPHATTTDGAPLYRLLDGHHRWLASHIAGRADALALIHYEPGDPGYDEEGMPPCRN